MTSPPNEDDFDDINEENSGLPRLKLLLVEDNSETAESLALAFTTLFHFDVETIGYSGKCLETLPENYEPDYTVFDVSMPRDFVQKVIDRFHVPAVGMTGDLPETANPLPSGTPVFQKPVEPAIIVAALEAVRKSA